MFIFMQKRFAKRKTKYKGWHSPHLILFENLSQHLKFYFNATLYLILRYSAKKL